MTDLRHLNEVTLFCRTLSIAVCATSCLTLVIHVVAGFFNPSGMFTDNNTDTELYSVVNFIAVVVMSFVAAITSALLAVATYRKNVMFAAPYFCFHLILMLYCFGVFVFYLIHAFHIDMIQIQYMSLDTRAALQLFGYNIVKNGGSFFIFSLLLLLVLLGVTIIPIYSFLRECRQLSSGRGMLGADRRVHAETSTRGNVGSNVPLAGSAGENDQRAIAREKRKSKESDKNLRNHYQKRRSSNQTYTVL